MAGSGVEKHGETLRNSREHSDFGSLISVERKLVTEGPTFVLS